MDIYDRYLSEIFVIHNANSFKEDFKNFLRDEFKKGNLQQQHGGISTTEFDSEQWLSTISDNIANRLAQYFETIRSQTERDLKSKVPIYNN